MYFDYCLRIGVFPGCNLAVIFISLVLDIISNITEYWYNPRLFLTSGKNIPMGVEKLNVIFFLENINEIITIFKRYMAFYIFIAQFWIYLWISVCDQFFWLGIYQNSLKFPAILTFENNIWHCFILSPLIIQREKGHFNFDVNKKYWNNLDHFVSFG